MTVPQTFPTKSWASAFLTACLFYGGSVVRTVVGCTNVLVTPGASADGSSMIAYNADSGNLVGMLYHYPPSSTSDGGGEESDEATKMRMIYGWDSGKFLGEIPEADVTYNVVGNTNEHGLVIAETTFGGIEALNDQPGAVIDYGSLIYIALQRCQTAREAIRTMTSLLDQYGYASEGESFSIADYGGEVWIMEVIGRGSTGRKGAVWVARRVPDGYVSAHANQARITTFPRDDPENCLYSDDVVDLAVSVGLYQRGVDGDDSDFSFSDVYDPVSFLGARACEARVWSVFGAVSEEGKAFLQRYADYAHGENLSNRMPLWIEPKSKLGLDDLMGIMADHYEGTDLDFRSDVGAGPHDAPYRPRPLTWKEGDRDYHNERAIATQQTGWNFVAQVRPPRRAARPLSSLLWFAADDSSTTPRYPVYGSSRRVSAAYGGVGTQDGNPVPALRFDLTKAFWVQNMVSNLAYSRWDDVYPLVRERIRSIQAAFVEEVRAVDEAAARLLETDSVAGAVEHVTEYSTKAGDELHARWLDFYGELFARFRDGYDIQPKADDPFCGCSVHTPGFSDDWKGRIISETGTRYEIIGEGNGADSDHSDPSPQYVATDKSALLRSSMASPAVALETDDVVKPSVTNKLSLKALQ